MFRHRETDGQIDKWVDGSVNNYIYGCLISFSLRAHILIHNARAAACSRGRCLRVRGRGRRQDGVSYMSASQMPLADIGRCKTTLGTQGASRAQVQCNLRIPSIITPHCRLVHARNNNY